MYIVTLIVLRCTIHYPLPGIMTSVGRVVGNVEVKITTVKSEMVRILVDDSD